MPKDQASQSELHDAFWSRASNIRAGMLSAKAAPARPMAHIAKAEDTALWFVTAAGTDIDQAAASGSAAHFTLACAHGQLYALVDGTLSQETSSEKLDDVWSPMAGAWFEEGRSDEDIRLVRFTPHTAEIWATDGGGKALYEFAKAALSDERPDLGDHGTIRFSHQGAT